MQAVVDEVWRGYKEGWMLPLTGGLWGGGGGAPGGGGVGGGVKACARAHFVAALWRFPQQPSAPDHRHDHDHHTHTHTCAPPHPPTTHHTTGKTFPMSEYKAAIAEATREARGGKVVMTSV